MTIWVYTGGRPSNGAKELASQPGFKRCRTGKGIKPGDLFINWGNTNPLPLFGVPKILNTCASISVASNKLKCFQALTDVNTVEWTTGYATAMGWWVNGDVVVARNKLTGHSGDGIIIYDKSNEIVEQAPLYTKYVFKAKEFRVHVCNGKVIDTQRKIRDPEREVVTWKVRSHANGFIYARNGVEHCGTRDELACSAVSACGLDFGAVDIIQDKAGTYYVLEINTAPGLEGQTVERYAEAFRNV